MGGGWLGEGGESREGRLGLKGGGGVQGELQLWELLESEFVCAFNVKKIEGGRHRGKSCGTGWVN